MRERFVWARANLIAPSFASVPELQKKTAESLLLWSFTILSASSPLSSAQSSCTIFDRSISIASLIALPITGLLRPIPNTP